MNISDSTRAYLGGVEAFDGDYIKYLEAIYSDKDNKIYYPDGFSEDKRSELIDGFLKKSTNYYKNLQNKVDREEKYEISYVSNKISSFIQKIIEISPIK